MARAAAATVLATSLAPLALAAALLVAGSGPAAGGPLEELLTRVYLESPRLAAGRAALRAADEEVPLAKAPGRPALTSRSSVGYAWDPAGGGGRPTTREAVSLAQSVYDGGETGAAAARAGSVVLAERARLADLEQEVLLDAATAFVAVARDQALLDRARDNERRLTLLLGATRDRVRFGDLTRTDEAQARSRQAGSVAERVRAEGELAVSAADYARVAGDPPAGRVELPPAPDPLPGGAEELRARAEEGFAAEAARHELAAAEAGVAAARSAFRPRLGLAGDLSHAYDPGGRSVAGDRGGAAVSATLQVPFYQGGGEHARLRQSRDLREQRRHALDEARRRAVARAAAAGEDARTLGARILSLEAQADSAAFALEGVRQEALAGARTATDVLDAEADLYRAEVELVRARAGQVVAAYRLRAAAGGMTAAGLGLDVEVYDPAAHQGAARGRWFGIGAARSDR